MTKRAARLFFFIATGLSALIFTVLTIDSHRQFPRLTNAAALDERVVAGKDVWHRYNCVNCHTLLGEGAYYAPDLTQITSHRGAPYLRQFLKDPSKFYSEQRDGRLMPTLNLSDRDIDDVIAFLSWISRIDTQGWPPRPILVRGSAVPGAVLGAPPPQPASGDPVELGRAAYNSILEPNAHVLAGPTYAAGGRSLMPGDYGQTLKPEQVDQIVAYLLTLR